MLLFPATRMLSWFALTAAGTSFTWTLWQKTHQGWWIAAAGMTGVIVGVVCAPLSGWLADSRWRKKVLIISPLCSAAIYIMMTQADSPTMLIILVGLAAAAVNPFHPTFTAALLGAFGEQERIKVLGWTTSAESMGIVAGTISGGAVMTLSPSASFWGAATCLCGVSLLSSRLQLHHISRQGKEKSSIWAGIGVIRKDRILALMVGSVFFMAISRQLAIVAEPALVGAINGNSLTLSLISAAWSVGMIAGGLAAARWAKQRNSIRYLWQARLLVAIGMGFNFLAYYQWQPILAYVVCGLVWAWIPVSSGTVIAQRCPEDRRGRLLALQGALAQAAAALGIVAAGTCIQLLGVRQSFLFASLVGMFSVPPLLLASRRYKHEQQVEV